MMKRFYVLLAAGSLCLTACNGGKGSPPGEHATDSATPAEVPPTEATL